MSVTTCDGYLAGRRVDLDMPQKVNDANLTICWRLSKVSFWYNAPIGNSAKSKELHFIQTNMSENVETGSEEADSKQRSDDFHFLFLYLKKLDLGWMHGIKEPAMIRRLAQQWGSGQRMERAMLSFIRPLTPRSMTIEFPIPSILPLYSSFPCLNLFNSAGKS